MAKSSQKRARKRVDFLLDLYRTKPDRFCLEMNRRIQGWLHVAVRCWERPTTSTREGRSFEDFVTRLERDIATLADAEEDLKRLMYLGPLLRSEATHARARVLDPRLYQVTVNFLRPVWTSRSCRAADSTPSLTSRAMASPQVASALRSSADSQE